MAKDKVTKDVAQATEKVKRVFGKKKNIGDIIEVIDSGEMFCRIKAGFFGYHTIKMKKNEDNTFSLEKTYFVENELKSVKLGKTFPATDKENNPIEGITQVRLGLNTLYSEEMKKDITGTNDALFLSTHMLKTPKELSNGVRKIGWIDGRFGIEVD